jgi:hypothetical protein
MHDERTLYDVWMAARMTYVINACMLAQQRQQHKTFPSAHSVFMNRLLHHVTGRGQAVVRN